MLFSRPVRSRVLAKSRGLLEAVRSVLGWDGRVEASMGFLVTFLAYNLCEG